MADDGKNLMCQGCGIKTPTIATTTGSAPSNDNSSITNKDNRDKPTLPKESKSKIKQKGSLENKSFIITQDDTRKRGPFEGPETDEDLGALNYFSRLYGNVGDY